MKFKPFVFRSSTEGQDPKLSETKATVVTGLQRMRPMVFGNLVFGILGVSLLGQFSLGSPIKFSGATGQKILVVGDSHLGGTYGQRLYRRLSYNPTNGVLDREVSLYSACGSTSKDWSVFDPALQRAAPCGLRIAKPNAQEIKEVPPKVVETTVNGRPKKKYIYPQIPILGDLLQGGDFSYSAINPKPDVLIVSLGTNMIGSIPQDIPDTEKGFQDYYDSRVWALRNNYPGLFGEIDKIFAAQSLNAPYARCVWVGPPVCDRMADKTPCFPRLKILNRTMAKVLQGRCDYVDSTKLTRYPPEADPQMPLTDGYHFRTTCRAKQAGCKEMTATMSSIAEKWADSVIRFLITNKIVKATN
ncbi:MAG: SGNH/GDSL hydrolase family protein [Bdellovibrionales bacterium]|nr:SGNH/GDSL hydrolase family protein [Bdellovibrionales bacterium]